MNCSGNVSQNWSFFSAAFEDYITATELKDKSDLICAAALKSIMGKECREILSRLEITEEDMKDAEKILDTLGAHFCPKKNILYERFLFHGAEQQSNETIDQFMIRLKQLSEACCFKTLNDEMLRDRLVLGCKDKSAKARLFREEDCDLKKSLDSLRISETTQAQLKIIGDEEKETVNVVTAERKFQKKSEFKQKSGTHGKKDFRKDCMYCGTKHAKWKCPAYGKKCAKCGRENHFDSVCRSYRDKVSLK